MLPITKATRRRGSRAWPGRGDRQWPARKVLPPTARPQGVISSGAPIRGRPPTARPQLALPPAQRQRRWRRKGGQREG
ncbi:hypothetical protein GW17_00038786 [Ensete ventricosum]|nr:hypothetical protein GW17_00038786 [Ensete ventricosum]